MKTLLSQASQNSEQTSQMEEIDLNGFDLNLPPTIYDQGLRYAARVTCEMNNLITM